MKINFDLYCTRVRCLLLIGGEVSAYFSLEVMTYACFLLEERMMIISHWRIDKCLLLIGGKSYAYFSSVERTIIISHWRIDKCLLLIGGVTGI